MGLKPDTWIEQMVQKYGMIEPFEPRLVRDEVISFGLSSYGYDVRLAGEFRVLKDEINGILDPKDFRKELFEEIRGDECVIPPNSLCLARTLEYFRIPRGVLGLCLGKSTYARCGLIVNITPLEPEWEGYITVGILNTARIPAKVYAGEGIAQVIFIEADDPCRTSYADRRGKYQAQVDLTPPKI